MGQTQPPPLRHSAEAACLGTQFCHKCSNYVTVAINVTGKIREAHVRVGTVEVPNTVAEYNAVFKRSEMCIRDRRETAKPENLCSTRLCGYRRI